MEIYFRSTEEPLVFGYGRTSTNKQEMSIQLQESKIRERASTMQAPWGHYYADEAVSATETGIPFARRFYGRQLMQIVRPGDHLIVWKLDRFGRKLKDIVEVLDFFTRQEVNIYVLQHGAMHLDLTTSIGRLIVGVLAVFANFEGDLIRERTRESFAFRREHGMAYSWYPPFGKRQVRVGPKGSGGHPVLLDCPEEVALLRKAYFMHRQLKVGIREIARAFNTAGQLTAQGGRWSKSRLHRGLQWYRKMIQEGKQDDLV